ncbi:MAG TPA: HAD family hydrolase [Burkholderiales bacterium]|nr:HAD family hydrolase [Burkholderiales bacterium]
MKLVLLDVDGTLVDSNDLHVEAWRDAFRRHGKDLSREEVHAQMGKGGDQLVQVFLSPEEVRRFGKDVDNLHVEIFIDAYQPRERPLPGVRPLLSWLKSQGSRLVLASSAKEKELEGHLRILQIDDLLDRHTTSDDADHSKPCPDIFQAALGDTAPQDALVIGDSPYDAQAARKAGIPMVGVLTGGFTREALLRSGARAVYRDLTDLLEQWTRSP